MINQPTLVISDSHGIYVPRNFISFITISATYTITNVEKEAIEIVRSGPDHEHYWDAWDEIERDAIITDDDNLRYFIHMDGDCWIVPVGMIRDDGDIRWIWPELRVVNA